MAGSRKGRTEPNYPAASYDNTTGAPGPTAQPPATAEVTADNARERATRATVAAARGTQRSA